MGVLTVKLCGSPARDKYTPTKPEKARHSRNGFFTYRVDGHPEWFWLPVGELDDPKRPPEVLRIEADGIGGGKS